MFRPAREEKGETNIILGGLAFGSHFNYVLQVRWTKAPRGNVLDSVNLVVGCARLSSANVKVAAW